jgi:hypothetical protein
MIPFNNLNNNGWMIAKFVPVPELLNKCPKERSPMASCIPEKIISLFYRESSEINF